MPDYVGSLLEKVRECLARILRSTRTCFTFDDGSAREQFTLVVGVLIGDTRGDCFATFEPRAWIEICALTTCVKIAVALGTGGFEADYVWSLGTA